MMKTVDRFCELCHAQASLYCQSDAAFLCWSCDSNVHRANFLVARHVRRIICSKCKAFTGNPVFGFCAPCSLASSQNDHLDSLSSSSNSDCVSSTLSCTTNQKKIHSDRRKISRFNSSNSLNYLSSADCGKVVSSQRRSRQGGGTTSSIMDLKAEGVLAYWCRRLELTGDRAVRLGCNALRLCWNQMTVFPFRVSLAGALWFGLRNCGDRSLYTLQTLKRLEEISGVQAKLISAAESKLERALKVVATRTRIQQRNHRLQLEEGWAESECSS